MPDEVEIPFVPNYYPDGLVGFVYEADTYCVKCSKERFGQDLEIKVAGGHQSNYPYGQLDPDPPLDNEGNPVSAISGDMEFQCSLYCGDCGTNLSSEVSIIHSVLPHRKKCKYCGQTAKSDPDGYFIEEKA